MGPAIAERFDIELQHIDLVAKIRRVMGYNISNCLTFGSHIVELFTRPPGLCFHCKAHGLSKKEMMISHLE